MGATVLFFHQQTFAATVSQNWDFTVSGDYEFDASTVELSSNSARLKAQNYASDANTAALWHLDELAGTAAIDASPNNNTGQLNGSALFSAGKLNNAVELSANGEFVSVADSPSLTLAGQQTLEAWVKFDTGYEAGASKDAGVIDKGSYRLYFDRTSGRVNYEIAASNAESWTRRAGSEINGSWDDNGKTIVRSTVVHSGNVYVGLGLSTGDAEVWKWDGTNWSFIGGDGIRGSWADATFEDVFDLELVGDTLYAGLGTSAAGDAEVWRCDAATNCTDWEKVGGDGVNSSWPLNTFEQVTALEVVGSTLYAGIGRSANDAEVWRWNGTTWLQIGGDSLASGWTTNYETVQSLESDGTNLYAGIGDSAGDGEVYRYNGSTWTKIGGDGVNSSWSTASGVEYVASLAYAGGYYMLVPAPLRAMLMCGDGMGRAGHKLVVMR